MPTPHYFHHVRLDDKIKGKINNNIEISSTYDAEQLVEGFAMKRSGSVGKVTFEFFPAISVHCFAANADAVHFFVMDLLANCAGRYFVGFTDKPTHPSNQSGYPGWNGMTGTALFGYDGSRYHGDVPYLTSNITRKAKEIISILTISNNGAKKEIQWIVDGNDGPVHDCTKDYGNGNEIFPVVCLCRKRDHIRMIPFDQVKSTSPRIEELKKELNNQNGNNNNLLLVPSSSATSTAQNDVVISQLRDQVARSQDALIQEKDKQVKKLEQQLHQERQLLQQQLAAKDQLFVAQLELKDKQLELERAEHQKTKNILHATQLELKDAEIAFYNREKEFGGQRRQREEDQTKAKMVMGSWR